MLPLLAVVLGRLADAPLRSRTSWTSCIAPLLRSPTPSGPRAYPPVPFPSVCCANTGYRSVDVLLDYYINPIFEWTATCDTVPYLNFNDWLHYSTASSHTVAVE